MVSISKKTATAASMTLSERDNNNDMSEDGSTTTDLKPHRNRRDGKQHEQLKIINA